MARFSSSAVTDIYIGRQTDRQTDTERERDRQTDR